MAISVFSPGHTHVEYMLGFDFLHVSGTHINLFRCKGVDGNDALFLFDLMYDGGGMSSLSMIGPINFGQTGLLLPDNVASLADHLRDTVDEDDSPFIAVYNELACMIAQERSRTMEQESRVGFMAQIALSLRDSPDEGIGSLGEDNLALIAHMVV